MTIFSQPPYDTNTTLEAFVAYESGQVSYLGPGILLFIFLVIMGAGSFTTSRATNKSSVLTWLFISGFITSVIGFMLFLYPGIITLSTLITCVSITIMFAILYLLGNLLSE